MHIAEVHGCTVEEVGGFEEHNHAQKQQFIRWFKDHVSHR